MVRTKISVSNMSSPAQAHAISTTQSTFSSTYIAAERIDTYGGPCTTRPHRPVIHTNNLKNKDDVLLAVKPYRDVDAMYLRRDYVLVAQ
jgi:hypothetical protein